MNKDIPNTQERAQVLLRRGWGGWGRGRGGCAFPVPRKDAVLHRVTDQGWPPAAWLNTDCSTNPSPPSQVEGWWWRGTGGMGG